jgi:hypothetical protein
MLDDLLQGGKAILGCQRVTVQTVVFHTLLLLLLSIAFTAAVVR